MVIVMVMVIVTWLLHAGTITNVATFLAFSIESLLHPSYLFNRKPTLLLRSQLLWVLGLLAIR